MFILMSLINGELNAEGFHSRAPARRMLRHQAAYQLKVPEEKMNAHIRDTGDPGEISEDAIRYNDTQWLIKEV